MGLKRLLLIAALVGTALLGVGVCLAPAQVVGPSAQPSKSITATLSSTTCPGTGCVTLEVSGYASAAIQITGTWSTGMQLQGSLDGVVWEPTSATQGTLTNESSVFIAPANGLYFASVGGLKYLRMYFVGWDSGSATVTIQVAAGGIPQRRENPQNQQYEPGAGITNVQPIGVADSTGVLIAVPRLDTFNNLQTAGYVRGADGTYIGNNSDSLTVYCTGGCSAGTPGQTTMAASSPVVIASDQSAVHTVCDSGCGSPPATADGTAFSFGTTNVSPVAFVVDDVASTTVAENAYGIARMTPNRIQYVDLSKSGSNTSSFKVDFGGSGQPVTLATLPALVAGAAIIGNVRIDQTTPGTTNGVQVNAALPAGANVIGHVIVDTTSTTTVTQATGTNLHAVLDSGTLTTVTAVTGITNALPAGSNVIGHVIADSGSTTAVTSLPAITGTVTANAGSNLNTSLLALESTQTLQATATKQDTGNTSLGTIKTNTDPLVTAGAGGYVRQDSTATIAKETGGNLATVNTNTAPLVVSGAGGYVRQDSTATIAKESGGNLATIVTNTTNIATAARQDTGNTSVASIDAKTPALGQQLAASSQPVVLTAIQVAALTPPTNTGYALDSSLTTLNAKDFATQTTLAAELAMLTTLTAKIIQNQQTMANSLSVTLAVDQPPILTRTNPLLNTLPCNALRRTNCSPKGF